MTHYVLILAGGRGIRLNSKTPKQFLELAGYPMLTHSIRVFNLTHPKSKIYVSLPNGYKKKWLDLCKKYNFQIPHKVYRGGERRMDTVYLGLQKILTENSLMKSDLVSIHDAARPFLDSQFIMKLITCARERGTAIPVVPLKNSLRRVLKDSNSPSIIEDRENFREVQTPQVFHFSQILAVYNQHYKNINIKSSKLIIKSDEPSFLDDSSIYQTYLKKGFHPLCFVEGKDYNLKITTSLDYYLAKTIHAFLNTK